MTAPSGEPRPLELFAAMVLHSMDTDGVQDAAFNKYLQELCDLMDTGGPYYQRLYQEQFELWQKYSQPYFDVKTTAYEDLI